VLDGAFVESGLRDRDESGRAHPVLRTAAWQLALFWGGSVHRPRDRVAIRSRAERAAAIARERKGDASTLSASYFATITVPRREANAYGGPSSWASASKGQGASLEWL